MIDPITSSILLNMLNNMKGESSNSINEKALNNISSNLQIKTSDSSNLKEFDSIINILSKITKQPEKELQTFFKKNPKSFLLLIDSINSMTTKDASINDSIGKIIQNFEHEISNSDIKQIEKLFFKATEYINSKENSNSNLENIETTDSTKNINKTLTTKKSISDILPEKQKLITKLFNLIKISNTQNPKKIEIANIPNLENLGISIKNQKDFFLESTDMIIINKIASSIQSDNKISDNDSKFIKKLTNILKNLYDVKKNIQEIKQSFKDLTTEKIDIKSIYNVFSKMTSKIDKDFGLFIKNIADFKNPEKTIFSIEQIDKIFSDEKIMGLLFDTKKIISKKPSLFKELNIFKLFFSKTKNETIPQKMKNILEEDIMTLIKNKQENKSQSSKIPQKIIQNLIKLDELMYNEISIPFYDDRLNSYLLMSKKKEKRKKTYSITIKSETTRLGKIDVTILKQDKKFTINFNAEKKSRTEISNNLSFLLERLDGFSIRSIT